GTASPPCSAPAPAAPAGPAEARARRRLRVWPRTVRLRVTVAATLLFAIALSASAFGLVRVVHNNLVDRINETNQQQLYDLAVAVRNANIQPPPGPQRVVYAFGPDG